MEWLTSQHQPINCIPQYFYDTIKLYDSHFYIGMMQVTPMQHQPMLRYPFSYRTSCVCSFIIFLHIKTIIDSKRKRNN